MNRRTFFKRAAQVAAAVVIAPTVLEAVAVPKATAYRTYIMGSESIVNGHCPPLTVADIRRLKEQLCSTAIRPGQSVYGWIHPETAKALERDLGYKLRWSVSAR
jgi:hypothetical protein